MTEEEMKKEILEKAIKKNLEYEADLESRPYYRMLVKEYPDWKNVSFNEQQCKEQLIRLKESELRVMYLNKMEK